jgi:dihydrodipicolinate synthase/N-acetylneuraminate lyase
MKEWGILVPIVTPCNKSGDLDKEGLSRVVMDMVSSGCHSLFIGSSTGRGPWLSRGDL